ncbi:MAG: Two component regulator three Y domain protein, partial [Flavobacteriaceae bacterium]|nr:Two component regulator three Y domain protein [Flavobacteriaceae bacterium]
MKTIKITLLFCLITTLAFCTVSIKEKNALLAICNATNGDNWTVTWNGNTPVSNWNGVTVENDKVVALDLSFNNL